MWKKGGEGGGFAADGKNYSLAVRGDQIRRREVADEFAGWERLIETEKRHPSHTPARDSRIYQSLKKGREGNHFLANRKGGLNERTEKFLPRDKRNMFQVLAGVFPRVSRVQKKTGMALSRGKTR